jgi:hypothetical protein
MSAYCQQLTPLGKNSLLSLTSDKMSYSLYAISNHYGTLGQGHYTASCLHASGSWFTFDDTKVSDLKFSDVSERKGSQERQNNKLRLRSTQKTEGGVKTMQGDALSTQDK